MGISQFAAKEKAIMDFDTLQSVVKKWATHNFPNTKPYQPLLGVAEEVGELCHAHLKIEQGIRKCSQEDKFDAVGDIIIYLADYCNRNDISMEHAVLFAWENASKRDWIKYSSNGVSE